MMKKLALATLLTFENFNVWFIVYVLSRQQ